MYTPGFAAPEQYREGDSERLGPWTDLYGVGASLFACFAAFAPQAADSRQKEDHYVAANKLWMGKYSPRLLSLVDQCLKLDPLQRPQSVYQVQKMLLAAPEQPKLRLLARIIQHFRPASGKSKRA
jgi:serine/threonine protein kinase